MIKWSWDSDNKPLAETNRDIISDLLLSKHGQYYHIYPPKTSLVIKYGWKCGKLSTMELYTPKKNKWIQGLFTNGWKNLPSAAIPPLHSLVRCIIGHTDALGWLPHSWEEENPRFFHVNCSHGRPLSHGSHDLTWYPDTPPLPHHKKGVLLSTPYPTHLQQWFPF